MAEYKVVFKTSARKQLNNTPQEIKVKLLRRIGDLSTNPRPQGALKLKGGRNQYRIRQGDYRVIYEIVDKIVTVTVVKVGHRSRVYT